MCCKAINLLRLWNSSQFLTEILKWNVKVKDFYSDKINEKRMQLWLAFFIVALWNVILTIYGLSCKINRRKLDDFKWYLHK